VGSVRTGMLSRVSYRRNGQVRPDEAETWNGWVRNQTCHFQEVAIVEENRRPRFRFRLRMLLFAVAILALLLVIVIQQVQIGRQQVQIKQMRQQVDRYSKERDQLTTILREQRDHLERAGSSSDGRHR
jgi:hypothetical protein